MKSNKFLSVIISVVLVFSTFVFPVHADFEEPLYETVIHNIAAKCTEKGITEDGNFIWFLADMKAYEELYPKSGNILSAEELEKCEEKLLNFAQNAETGGDLAKSIIGFRALGYDASEIYKSYTDKLEIVEKLSALIDGKSKSVTNIFSLPYVVIAMRDYVSAEQEAYLLKAMLKQKLSWQSSDMGIDAATPMLLALLPYYNLNEEVKSVADETVQIILSKTDENGLISNAPSTGLAIAALSAFNADDKVLEKMINGLLGEATQELDGFMPENNSFGTEQGFRGLIGYKLRQQDKTIFDFSEYPKNKFKKYEQTIVSNEQVAENAGQGISIKNDNEINVTVRIMAHNASECNNSYTYKSNAAKYSAILEEMVDMQKNETVFDATVKVLSENGIPYAEKNGYISQIGDFSEFDHGEFSGWMFMVNGKHQTEGSNYIELIPNSTVLWFYTDDYRYEKGSENFGYPVKKEPVEKADEISKTGEEAKKAVSDTAEFVLNKVQNPQISSIGGEWAVIGLFASGISAPSEYFDRYYANVETAVKEKEGVLSNRKYTEYSRVVIALTLLGKNPQDVAGYDLTAPLCDFDKTISQGLNGAIWALIALDCGNYGKSEIRERYIDYILDRELKNGGWALTKEEKDADSDVTAMVLTALSNHTEEERVSGAVKRALECLSKVQSDNGGFSTYGVQTAESTAQVVAALAALGIDENDERFVKGRKTPTDCLLSYYKEGEGFSHLQGGETNLMATEQALYALSSQKRVNDGKAKLLNKNKFRDTAGSKNEEAILLMAEKGIINGMESNVFAPDESVTRAQFATMIVKGLGIKGGDNTGFSDVTTGDWFYPYVSGAYENGIIFGISDKEFNPNGNITLEEASAMLERAAKLRKIENKKAQNYDAVSYTDVSDWAAESLVFCVDLGIIYKENVMPKTILTRAEIAQMIYNLLKKAELI